MKFPDWLDAGRGRAATVAATLGVTQGAVSQWRSSGVPLDRMRAVVELSEGAVTLDDMVPEPPQRTAGRPCIDVAGESGGAAA